MSSAWRRSRRRNAARVRSSAGHVGSQGVRKARLSRAASTTPHSRLATPDADRARRRAAAAPVRAVRESRTAPCPPFQTLGRSRPAGHLADPRRQPRRWAGDLSMAAPALRTSSMLTPSMRAEHLVERQRPPVDQDLARELLGARRRLFERGQERDLHLRLGAANFRFVEPAAPPRRGNRARPRPPRRVPRPSRRRSRTGRRRKVPVERIDGIGEAALLAHFLEQPRRHAAARRRGEDMRGVVVGRADRAALEADDDMRLFEPSSSPWSRRRDRRRAPRPAPARRRAAEANSASATIWSWSTAPAAATIVAPAL